ncbi:MAG: glycosyltransferase family 2 protein [Acidobacteria bacterium]|nr:glycosyltransferase family 2 protein [Acidobacteriota bacterium]
MPSQITAIVPHWNRAELLGRLLASLAAQTLPLDLILIADNGSTDSSRDVAAAYNAEFLPSLTNQGFAAAVNRGVAAAGTRWVAILNNDVELHPACLEQLLQHAEDAQAWFAAPRLLQAARHNVLDGCFDLLARSACAWRAGHGAPSGAPFLVPQPITFAPLTATLIRRDLFQHAGPLDEQFGSYLEDVDFFLRCALTHAAGIYVPSATALHAGSATLGAWSPGMVELISRNQLLLAAKHFPLSYLWHVLAGQTLWGALAFRNSTGFAWLKGKLAASLLFPSVRRHSSPVSREVLDPILRPCERRIAELQQATTRDFYWRAYFKVVS